MQNIMMYRSQALPCTCWAVDQGIVAKEGTSIGIHPIDRSCEAKMMACRRVRCWRPSLCRRGHSRVGGQMAGKAVPQRSLGLCSVRQAFFFADFDVNDASILVHTING
jgi:hypothetical protein